MGSETTARDRAGGPCVRVRALEAHEWRLHRELRLRALADAPDAFASTLAREAPRPDAEWARRLAETAASPGSGLWIAEAGGRAVGLAAARVEGGAAEAHLYSMWVAPEARRAGAGRALLEAALAWAREARARCLVLQVTEGNAAAAHLYRGAGFAPTGQVEPLREGSPLRAHTLRREL